MVNAVNMVSVASFEEEGERAGGCTFMGPPSEVLGLGFFFSLLLLLGVVLFGSASVCAAVCAGGFFLNEDRVTRFRPIGS